jgi:hypothetical protein
MQSRICLRLVLRIWAMARVDLLDPPGGERLFARRYRRGGPKANIRSKNG